MAVLRSRTTVEAPAAAVICCRTPGDRLSIPDCWSDCNKCAALEGAERAPERTLLRKTMVILFKHAGLMARRAQPEVPHMAPSCGTTPRGTNVMFHVLCSSVELHKKHCQLLARKAGMMSAHKRRVREEPRERATTSWFTPGMRPLSAAHKSQRHMQAWQRQLGSSP